MKRGWMGKPGDDDRMPKMRGGGCLNPYWSEIFVRRGFWITDDRRISM